MAWEHIFPLPRFLVGDGTLFLVKVSGAPAAPAGFADGDWAVVRAQADAGDGEIVAAMIGGEAAVRTLRRVGGRTWLAPYGHGSPPVPGVDATVIGKVTALIRPVLGRDPS
jgi:repressor LexA